jgi:hypothetical protein
MTKADEFKPTARLCAGRFGDEFVVEVRRTTITIRPKGTRRGGPAEVEIGVGALHQRLMIGRKR